MKGPEFRRAALRNVAQRTERMKKPLWCKHFMSTGSVKV